ncbi:hypothetical protein MPSEU_000920500 [Mayamaea pseudoterrestris]|nr:hypothetical protein MPSEU_000920500 [Mayamaea pseudoterrestris]
MSGCNVRRTLFSSASSSRTYSTNGRPVRTLQQTKDDHKYCMQLVHDRDREGWLCGLLLPSQAQPAYFSVRAFNAELASIKELSGGGRNSNVQQQQPMEFTTSLAWQIRMQWWRDALANVYANDDVDKQLQRKHHYQTKQEEVFSSSSISCWQSPVVRQLDVAANTCQLTRRWLEKLLDARQHDLDRMQFVSMEEALEYADDVFTSNLFLTMEILQSLNSTGSVSIVDENAVDRCLTCAGVGVGLATMLRATPVRLAVHGECPLPRALLPLGFPYDDLIQHARNCTSGESSENDNDSDDEDILSEANVAIVNEAVRFIANEAILNFQQARALQGNLPKNLRMCLLPVVPSTVYLERLQAANYSLFDAKVVHDPTRLRLLLLLARTWMTGVL